MSIPMQQVTVPASSSSPGAPGQYAADDQYFYGYSLTGWRRLTWSTFGAVGTAYYVSTTGNDANPGTFTQPWTTLKHALPLLKPGDTLYLRGGTYTQSIDANAFPIPSGTSWTAPITIAGYPGETAILRPTTGNYVLFLTGPIQYLVFSGLILDGSGGIRQSGIYLDGNAAGAPTFLRFQNSEVRNCPSNGIIFGSTAGYATADHNQLLNVSSHDNGKATDTAPYVHGFYISTNYNLLQGCQAYNNSGHGIQIYKSAGFSGPHASNNTVAGCQIHDNGKALALGVTHNGLELDSGSDNLAYNNLIWNSGRSIQVNYGAKNAQIYNNTLYNCLDPNDGAISIGYGGGASNTLVRNNIISGSRGQDILNYGSGTVSDHNLLSTTNPLFVNASAHDFHLQAGSPAIGQGVVLAVVTTDFDGKPRPSSGYTLGAYER